MEALEIVVLLLVAVIASSLLDRVLRGVSLPLVQIGLGAVIAVASGSHLSLSIDTELLLVLFIAPLHFNESRHVDSTALWRNRRGIASLASGLVIGVMLAVGATLHAIVPAIPLAAALAVGAAMGSTDATAVTSLTRDVKFGKRHESLLAGEALFNDVLGTVGFQCAIAVAVSGSFSLVHAGEEVALELFGGMAAGAVAGLALWALLTFIRNRVLDSPTVHVTLELLAPFLVYFACEHLGVGGIIAVVVSGMVFSLLPQRKTASTARLRLQSKNVWSTVEFVLNGIIFVVLGMQLPQVISGGLAEGADVGAGRMVACILAVTFVLEAVRFVWVMGMDMVDAARRGRPVRVCFSRHNVKSALAMTFAGAKGGVTLSLILTIPAVLASGDSFPLRTEIVSLASGGILCTLLLANFAVPHLVPKKGREKRSAAYVDAEIVLLERVIASIQADAHLTGMVKEEEPAAASGSAAAVAPAASFAPAASTDPGLDVSGSAAAPDLVASTPGASGALPQVSAGSSALDMLADVDEPATAIVLHYYAERMGELAKHASPDVAARACSVVERCDELYRQADALAHALEELDYGEDDEDVSVLGARMAAAHAVEEAVSDIQDQALARELGYIKAMRRAGELTSEHAKALRDDVYVQQMAAE